MFSGYTTTHEWWVKASREDFHLRLCVSNLLFYDFAAGAVKLAALIVTKLTCVCAVTKGGLRTPNCLGPFRASFRLSQSCIDGEACSIWLCHGYEAVCMFQGV